jgi:hypothetical protein
MTYHLRLVSVSPFAPLTQHYCWQGGELFYGATFAALEEARELWIDPPAVELSYTPIGDGKWKGDMEPFGDEGAGVVSCAGGGGWHRRMLQGMYEDGMIYNGTALDGVTQSDMDCWLGGLISTGIAPQMGSTTTAEGMANLPTVKYWLDQFRRYGFASESSVEILHYADIFSIALQGGDRAG